MIRVGMYLQHRPESTLYYFIPLSSRRVSIYVHTESHDNQAAAIKERGLMLFPCIFNHMQLLFITPLPLTA